MVTKNNKIFYASIQKRLLARIFDLFIISIFVVLLGVLIFSLDKSFNWFKQLKLNDGWRYGLFVTLVFLFFFLWFVLIPKWCHKTLGMKIFKINYFPLLKKELSIFSLFKHDFFIWGLMSIFSLILGWILSFLKPNHLQEFIWGINKIFLLNKEMNALTFFYYLGIAFSCFYYFSFFILMFVLINLFVNKDKLTFYDRWSKISVVHFSPKETKKNHNNLTSIHYKLPGDILLKDE